MASNKTRKVLDIVILLFVFGYTVFGQETFNCKTHNDICGNGGTCDQTTLKCNCASGYHGYRCHVPDASPCTNTSFCGPNGECYVVNGANACGCNLAYLGAKCEINRAEVKCDGSGMDVTFRILKLGFNGAIMADDRANSTNSKLVALSTACSFSDDTENAGYLKMTVKVGQPTGNAPNECLTSYYTEVNDAVTGKSTTAYFRILYLSVVSSLDIGYSIRCDLKKDDLEVFSEVSNVVFDPNTVTTVGKNETYSPVKLEIQKPDGTPILLGTAVSLGDKLKLVFLLTDNIIFKAMTVSSITGNNTLEGNATKTFTFIANGCPTLIGQQIAGEQAVVTGADGKPGRSIALDMFKFPDSNSVGLTAKMAVCDTVDDAKCQAPTDCNAVRKAAASAGDGGTGTGGDTTGTGNNTATGSGDATGTGGDASSNSGTPTGGPASQDGAANANGASTSNDAGASNGANNGASNPANNGAGTNGKRKRRATAEESEQVLSTVLNIRGPESLNPAAGTALPVDKVEECFTQKEILAAINILGATVCVLFIACFVMCCLLLKRRGSKSSFGSLSNTKLSDRFHIPRAHVNEHINEAYTSL